MTRSPTIDYTIPMRRLSRDQFLEREIDQGRESYSSEAVLDGRPHVEFGPITIYRETPRAFCVRYGTRLYWIPKSQIVKRDADRLTVPAWLADKKGISSSRETNITRSTTIEPRGDGRRHPAAR